LLVEVVGLYTINPCAGDGMVVASIDDVNVTAGIKKPKLGLALKSSIALGLPAAPLVFIEMYWANTP